MARNRKKKGRRSKRHRHTPLAKHVKRGTALSNPILGGAPITFTDWERDLLPEHLWLAGLADVFGEGIAHGPFYEFMDALDEICPPRPSTTPTTPDRPSPRVEMIGLISDFAMVPEEKRAPFVESNERLIEELFCKPIGRILAFYPGNQAAWLVPRHLVERGGPLDPEAELGRLRRLVRHLYDSKRGLAASVRALPFGRALKHDSIRFNAGDERIREVVDAIKRYPTECDEEEQRRVESFTRTHTNQVYQWGEHYAKRAWPKYFWRHNFDLAPWRPQGFSLVGATPVREEDVPDLPGILAKNAEAVRSHLAKLPHRVRFDLYDPQRDEILTGLFSRAARFYCLVCEVPVLWSRDIGGIMLRCLAIPRSPSPTSRSAGTTTCFAGFREYGEGQEKLLMLHLEHNHPEDTSLEGRDAAMISEELGAFAAELMHIELGSWTKKDARKLAAEASMERFYRLVFAPSSGDVHGTWISLRQSNLLHCVEPLHRLHRLPSYVEPPAFLNILLVAQELFEHCVEVAAAELGYPRLAGGLTLVPQPVDTSEAADAR